MKVGVCIPNFSAPANPATIVEVAQAAEQLGYDSVWTTDHIMMPRGNDEPYGHIYEALTVLAYIAAVTRRVELGTSVIVLPPRNPVLIAKETASIDALSGRAADLRDRCRLDGARVRVSRVTLRRSRRAL